MEDNKTYNAIDKPKMVKVIGHEVAEEILQNIYADLGIELDDQDDEDKSSTKKILSALMAGRLEYENEIFTVKLLKPISGKNEIKTLTIKEPTGVQLRGMSDVKKKNDDVGRAMAILGEVTGLGLPMINKLGSRDLMLSVGIISLFL